MMDRAERVRLRALCEAATPGPWASESRGIVEGPDTAMVAVCGGRPTKDAALIVGAVNALPALLDDADAADARIAKAERERDEARAEAADLRATVDTMQAQLDAHREWLATAQASGDEARAEAERLREQARVWRTLAREGAIASCDLGVIGATEAALALASCARRAGQHASQGAAAEREACAAIAQGIAVAASRAADYTANTMSPDGDATWESGRAAGASQTERAIRARGAGGGA